MILVIMVTDLPTLKTHFARFGGASSRVPAAALHELRSVFGKGATSLEFCMGALSRLILDRARRCIEW